MISIFYFTFSNFLKVKFSRGGKQNEAQFEELLAEAHEKLVEHLVFLYLMLDQLGLAYHICGFNIFHFAVLIII